MLPILQIGPLAIQFPGLIWLLSIWLGLSLAERHSARRGVNPNPLYNLVFIALVAGVIGARLSYALRYAQIFLENPAGLIALDPSLLDPLGGAVTGLLSAAVYAQKKHLPLWPTLDALTPLLAVVALGAGFAHLASGAAFGAPTSLPWGIQLWGVLRHPSQIYEILAAGLILFILWPGEARSIFKWDRFAAPGSYFLSFLALSAAARLLLEAFRGDSLLLPGGLRSAQVIAWFVLALSLWGLKKRAVVLATGPD